MRADTPARNRVAQKPRSISSGAASRVLTGGHSVLRFAPPIVRLPLSEAYPPGARGPLDFGQNEVMWDASRRSRARSGTEGFGRRPDGLRGGGRGPWTGDR